ncbi:hyphally regulated cell wall protein 3-like [Mangifera indica]|uniref:hyphally regulated cell wall protein 3-like n=1 Tax=Mangifera indica TaxID=29780 RepID=UPI001CF96356|nr:hyphally regulated cell wall protein 3-like [Mangifera indica]XP_044485918.1 hyphally regulated cell wall protein 3-like [Mangifera indica]
MNSNYGKPKGSTPGSFSNFNFDLDLGLGSGQPKSLYDQKDRTTSSFQSSYSSSTTTHTQSKPTRQPNKPSWTHQPAPSHSTLPGLQNAPTSMVGDIHGKSWAPSSAAKSSSGIGIVDKNPNLFGDLVSSALGHGKSNSNVPLKNAAPVASNKSSYSMGNLADSLPKTSNASKSSGNWGSGESFGSYTGGFNSGGSCNVNVNVNVNAKVTENSNLGGPAMKSMTGNGMSANKDPFGSLFDLGSKQSGSLNSASKGNNNSGGVDSFGEFQNASKASTTPFPSSGVASSNNDFMGSNLGSDFGAFKDHGSQNKSSGQSQSTGGDPLDIFFSSSSAATGSAATVSDGGQQFSEDDWGLDSNFGGGNDSGGATTELEGLPPPPAGVTGAAAKNKGIDNQKAGQYADAIKWLSWAVILFEKSGDKNATKEVLSIRASCYKEVGEYKKAVADCSKVLEQDEGNVSVLVQRALLYESMEKYKLGAEDLRTVLKIDPINRIARSTIHRLTKMVD